MVTDWNTYVEFAETATANMCQDFIRIDPSILNLEPRELRGTGRYGCSTTRPSRSLVLDSREPGRRCVTPETGCRRRVASPAASSPPGAAPPARPRPLRVRTPLIRD